MRTHFYSHTNRALQIVGDTDKSVTHTRYHNNNHCNVPSIFSCLFQIKFLSFSFIFSLLPILPFLFLCILFSHPCSSSSSSCSSSSMSYCSYMAKSVIFLYITTLALLQLVSSSALCSHESDFFRISLQSQCPVAIAPYSPLQVDGNFIDRALASKQKTGYTSVLFYASWCPFSRRLYPTFEMLSFMFPQIEHLAVEQSSAFPSVFSRHGIPSFPSILIVNQTSRVRYHGPKDFLSLIQFYQKITGLEPVQYYNDDQPFSLQCGKKSILQSMSNVLSLREISRREPYLVFAILFLCLRVLLHMFPKVLTHLKAFWVLYVPHFNLGIFGETSQLMGRILHMVDVRRIWTKLRLCKTRNFHEGAKNARVWASSLTSVSLGESSSARSSSS